MDLQSYARQKAIEYVCPNSGEPTTPYEQGSVKELTALLMRTLHEYNQELIKACSEGLDWARHLLCWWDQPNCGNINLDKLEDDIELMTATLEQCEKEPA